MKESGKRIWKDTALLALGEGLCVAAALLIRLLLGQLGPAVVLGSLAGAMLAIGHFFSLAVSVTLAADRAEARDPAGAKRLLCCTYPLRLGALGVLLFLCARSGLVDLPALVLPLLMLRPLLAAGEFLRRKEG